MNLRPSGMTRPLHGVHPYRRNLRSLGGTPARAPSPGRQVPLQRSTFGCLPSGGPGNSPRTTNSSATQERADRAHPSHTTEAH